MNTVKNIPISWFDLVALAVIVVGFFRGRKRGMSEELLDVFHWLLAVVVAAKTYEFVGDFVFNFIGFFSLMVSRIIAYLAIVVAVAITFIIIKRVVGEKLVGSDLFGRLEYYLGMLAGMLRYFCMLLIVMSLVHSRLYTEEELEAQRKAQEKDFGDITLPTWGKLKEDIFKNSITGRFVEKNFAEHLMKPTHYEAPITDAGWGRKKEKEIDDLMKPRK